MKSKNNDLFFEEAIADSIAGDFDVVESPLSKSAFRLVLGLAALLGMAAVVWAAFLNTGENGFFYFNRAEANLNRVSPIRAPRGVIYDRFGEPLVKNVLTYNIVLIPSDLPRDAGEKRQIIETLAGALKISEEAVKDILTAADLKKYNSVLISRGVDSEKAAEIKALNLRGVKTEEYFKRDYLRGPAFSHLIGYTGAVSRQDLSENPDFLPDDEIGKIGLEAYYDESLRGVPGRAIISKDAKNNPLAEEREEAPRTGASIETTIDAGLQNYFYDRLSDGLRALDRVSGVGIALNPQTGEILALVSLPSFDGNAFSNGDSDKIAEFFSSSHKPLFNRAVSGVYNPGSTVKPLVAVAALAEKVITPQKEIFSSGSIEIPNPYNPERPSIFLDWKAHGWVDLYSALARSSNVYFYSVGGGFGDVSGLGIAKLKTYWEKFGFGKKSGVDLMGENDGFLPDPEEKEKRTGDIWRLGDTYNATIGQGDLLITPLQLINYISALADGGKLLRPYLAAKIKTESGKTIKETQPEILADYSGLRGEIAEVRKGMEDAVKKKYGTAHLLSGLPFSAAGKTGSAQIQNNAKTNAFFVGYAPADPPVGGPKIAILVLVEDAREGSLNAVPVAKDVLSWYYENRLNLH
ncbi:MAG: penicillin-binding protein 2 [Parcubacteria group bacterium]|nr:penicillin-binding protein 2 [Parcubacteria group bacterium]